MAVPKFRVKRRLKHVEILVAFVFFLSLIALLISPAQEAVPGSRTALSSFSESAFDIHNWALPSARRLPRRTGENLAPADQDWSLRHKDLAYAWEAANRPWWNKIDDASLQDLQRQGNSHIQTLPRQPAGAQPAPRTGTYSTSTLTDRALFGDLINHGASRFLNSFREGKNKSTASRESAFYENPFAEALVEALSDTGETNKPSTPDTVPAAEKAKTEGGDSGNPQTTTPSTASNPPKTLRPNFLFLGHSFDGRNETAIAALQTDVNGFELAGIGKQYFDLSIIQRNARAQESVAFGDLNSDGISDLVITDLVANRASVHLGNGINRYFEFSGILGGAEPTVATIADYNNDGALDLAVVYRADKNLVVDGKGLRRFVFYPTSRMNEMAHSLLPGDFNNDGINDLVGLNYLTSTASIYTNQGDGTFALSSVHGLDLLPFSEIKTDLNNDAVDDTIYVHSLGNHLSAVMRDGRDGSFANLGNFIRNRYFAFVLGDFNSDGVVDIALAMK